jgi:hypothetical protein
MVDAGSRHRVERTPLRERLAPGRQLAVRALAPIHTGPLVVVTPGDPYPEPPFTDPDKPRSASGGMLAGIVIVISVVVGLTIPAIVRWTQPTSGGALAAASAGQPRTAPSGGEATPTAGTSPTHRPSSGAALVGDEGQLPTDGPSPGSHLAMQVNAIHPRAGTPVTVVLSGSTKGHHLQINIVIGGEPLPLGIGVAGANGTTSEVITIPVGLTGSFTLTSLDAQTGATGSVPINIISDPGSGSTTQSPPAPSDTPLPSDTPSSPAPPPDSTTDSPTSSDAPDPSSAADGAADPEATDSM